MTLKRYVHDRREKFATPNPSSSPAPTSLTFGSKTAGKTDNDNAKQQKRKIEDNSNCSQPLAAHKLRTLCSNRRGKGRLSAHPDGTIAVLDQKSAIFSLHNRAAGRGPYISYGRNLQTCLNRPERATLVTNEENGRVGTTRQTRPFL